MEYIQDATEFRRWLFWNCHCVNAGQSPEERRLKYKLCRYLGKSYHDARILRDWHPNAIAKQFGYTSWDKMIELLNK